MRDESRRGDMAVDCSLTQLLEIQFGDTVRRRGLETQFWGHSLETQYGDTVWRHRFQVLVVETVVILVVTLSVFC